MIINKNELAFPCSGTEGVNPESLGMSLRDYFAAKAMQAMLTKGIPLSWTEYDLSLNAYRIANGMIQTKEAKEKQ